MTASTDAAIKSANIAPVSPPEKGITDVFNTQSYLAFGYFIMVSARGVSFFREIIPADAIKKKQALF